MDNSQVAAALRDLADRLSDGPLVDGYVIAIRKQGYWYTEGGDSWDREAADGAIGTIQRHMAMLREIAETDGTQPGHPPSPSEVST